MYNIININLDDRKVTMEGKVNFTLENGTLNCYRT